MGTKRTDSFAPWRWKYRWYLLFLAVRNRVPAQSWSDYVVKLPWIFAMVDVCASKRGVLSDPSGGGVGM
jgi:hypothetical protein